MCEDNQTEVAEFFLLGFQNLHTFKSLLFIVFFLCYMVILNGNFIIIVLISINDHLKIPMFYFLKHLAIADLILTTTIIPMMLEIILKDGITISVTACIIQLHWFANCGIVQCLLIAIMSYDRYLAICNPMRYHSIMQPHVCLQMVVWSWLLVVFVSGEFILVYQLHFCGGKNIDHFFCDSGPVIELSTSDISLFVMVDLSLSIIVVFVPFAFIIVTYVFISFTILQLSSTNGRRKAFSTCSSHLATVCTYYGSLMAIYLTPADKRSPNTNKCMSLFYIVTTPLLNPIIYSLRNHKIRKSLKKMFRHFKTLNLH
ncbi:olfactory receptor 11L1-like [Rana temporaria]|uniref:olfactory receptor 11L1-like n=1 Tax=Rana temporaria TaxID=8407 RepID=UPI001AAD81F4|nr:olfactory receptor 11L1-like [Rana temporaria]